MCYTVFLPLVSLLSGYPSTLAKKKSEHYVDNKAFLEALIQFRAACKLAKKLKQPAPRVPEYVGECILKIATHLSYRPNFVNYTFRDDMISDGIENCLIYIHNFDPKKTKNPFGYFTQVIYFAFIRRIEREKKHTFVKYKMMEHQQIAAGPTTGQQDAGHDMLHFDNVKDFINRFEEKTAGRRERRRTATAARRA